MAILSDCLRWRYVAWLVNGLRRAKVERVAARRGRSVFAMGNDNEGIGEWSIGGIALLVEATGPLLLAPRLQSVVVLP